METYFLQNTGRVLLVSIVQFSLLYLLYVCLKNTVLRKISARADYLVLLLFIFTGTAMFLSGIYNSFSATNNTPFFYPGELGSEWNSLLNPVMHWLAAAYLFVAAIRAVILIWQMCFPGYRKQLSPVTLNSDFSEYLETFCAHVRIRLPKMMFSKKVSTPFVTGLFRSIIIIPASFQNCFTPQEMEAVILHEIAHLKRFDILLNMLVICCSQLLFFNPFAVLLIRRLRLQREVACDDWVLARQVKPKHYAAALYKAARNQHNTPVWQMAMGAGNGELYGRIERLFSGNRFHHPYKIRIKPFALLLFCFPLMMNKTVVDLREPQSLAGVYYEPKPALLSETNLPVITNTYKPVKKAAAIPVRRTNRMLAAISLPAHKKPLGTAFVEKRITLPEANNLVIAEPVSDVETNIPKAIFVSAGSKRTDDIVLLFSDSVNLYANFITRNNIETITGTQLEKVMNWVALGVNKDLDTDGNMLYFETPGVKVNVTREGEKNLFFANVSVLQQTQYDAYFQQWKIRFSIMNGEQQLGDRFVTIYQKKKLQSARL